MRRLLQSSLMKNNRFQLSQNYKQPRPDETNDVNRRLFNDAEWVGYQKDNEIQGQYETMPTVKKLDPKQHIEENEIKTRIMRVISHFEQINIKTFDFSHEFKAMKLDSLEQIAVLTSIEEEFHTVFEDNVFESFNNMNQVVTYLKTDDCF